MATRVIFLGGLGRSGTTLLERLLGEVPGVVPLGEVAHLWARGVRSGEPCGCGERLTECPFWRKVGERAFGGWSDDLARRVLTLRRRVDRTRRIPLLAVTASDEPGRAEYTVSYARLYEAAGEIGAGRLVVDSSKHASLAFCLRGAVDLRVVHVVRDPRAVAYSWARRVRRPEDGAEMTRWGPLRTAVHWVVQNLAFELLARRGVPVIRVRYENLLADPRTVFAELLDALGLHSDLGFLGDDLAELTTAHTASGNPMRFVIGTLALRRDDTWHRRLPRAHRALVTALTWPLLLHYGYHLGTTCTP